MIGSPSRLRLLRNMAFQPSRRFLHEELGFNFRLTNVQAAIGLAQVEQIGRDRGPQARDRSEVRSRPGGTSSGVRLQPDRDWARSVYWMNGLVLDRETGLDAQHSCRTARGLMVSRPGRSSSACTASQPSGSAACSGRGLSRSQTRSANRACTFHRVSASTDGQVDDGCHGAVSRPPVSAAFGARIRGRLRRPLRRQGLRRRVRSARGDLQGVRSAR